jgi:TM2 domain-containing membrane protein YozV
MKLKLLLSVLAIFVISVTSIYASFPVQNSSENGTTEVVQQDEDVLMSPAAASSGKSQVIALVLVLLVGGIGIHRFYLGYTWQGIVQLLTLGACGVWSLIDLVRIVTGDLKPKNGNYSKTL